jgi:hypothetical protein
MFARNVALHLKPNTLSDFTKTFDTSVLPNPTEAKGVPERNNVCHCWWNRRGRD